VILVEAQFYQPHQAFLGGLGELNRSEAMIGAGCLDINSRLPA
jgi:hypothetical protein